MQTILTEATAAYSPAGMSGLFFIPELLMAGAIGRDLTNQMPAEFAPEHLDTGILTSPAKDDDDVTGEGDDDIDEIDEDDDEDDEEDDLDEEDDELEDDDEDDLDDEDEDVEEEEEP